MSTQTLVASWIHSQREQPKESPWRTPLLVALGVQLFLVIVGFYSAKDNILDLINNGETLAVAPIDPQSEQKPLEIDLVPPPPLELNPDFVKPTQVIKRIEPPVVKPKLVVKQEPESKPQLKYAASGVVIGDKNFPKPEYPYEAKLRRFQGTVIVAISLVNGEIVSTDVTSSSGYGILDTSTTSWIRQHWKFPPFTGTETVPVRYQLAS